MTFLFCDDAEGLAVVRQKGDADLGACQYIAGSRGRPWELAHVRGAVCSARSEVLATLCAHAHDACLRPVSVRTDLDHFLMEC